MSSPEPTNVLDTIEAAERVLPGQRAPEGELDERWQAIIKIHDFIQTDPAEVWRFIDRWGRHKDDDLRMAIATVLLEHLLEYWFERFFPRVEAAVTSDARFAYTFSSCWKLGETELAQNSKRFDALKKEAKLIWGK